MRDIAVETLPRRTPKALDEGAALIRLIQEDEDRWLPRPREERPVRAEQTVNAC